VNDLNREQVRRGLMTEHYGRALTIVAETGSTNDDARTALSNGAPSGLTIVADRQTHGRGSRARTWESPGGTDLYLSIIDRPKLTPALLPTLTLSVGLALADTIDAYVQASRRVTIKWPNDVWIDDQKCSGILVEAVATGATIDGVVIGIGLNVNRIEWPEDLRSIATSLQQATGRSFDRNEVLTTVLLNTERRVERLVRLGSEPMIREVNQRLALRGERVRCDDVEGIVIEVAPSGALRLNTSSGIIEAISGTVTRAAQRTST
jgi:BirA family biotin operon repressor/biotin-[acetyl-CoA-carboxylase] ligase